MNDLVRKAIHIVGAAGGGSGAGFAPGASLGRLHVPPCTTTSWSNFPASIEPRAAEPRRLTLIGTLQRRVEANEADSTRLRAEDDDDPELELALMSGRGRQRWQA